MLVLSSSSSFTLWWSEEWCCPGWCVHGAHGNKHIKMLILTRYVWYWGWRVCTPDEYQAKLMFSEPELHLQWPGYGLGCTWSGHICPSWLLLLDWPWKKKYSLVRERKAFVKKVNTWDGQHPRVWCIWNRDAGMTKSWKCQCFLIYFMVRSHGHRLRGLEFSSLSSL